MKLLRNLLKGTTLTAALFVFQACYGTPGPPPMPDGEETYMAAEDSFAAGDADIEDLDEVDIVTPEEEEASSDE